MAKVSVVVPIYNVEKYLPMCLDSICGQTMKDIEIICVDDGSKDNSLKVIQRYQSKDKRVKCITKKNSGYGNTMNRGFDAATGEYIAIAESDDYIVPDTCEYLYNIAKQFDLDIVKSDYFIFYGDTKKTEYVPTCSDPSFYNVVIGEDKPAKVFDFRMNTWTGLYKKEFIRCNNIRHNETPGASYQDNGFWFQTISLAKKLMFVNKAFYHYRQDNPNSSINSKGKIHCMSDEYDFIYSFMKDNPDIHKKYLTPYIRKRFFNCMTTYERVSNENKLLFLERFSEDLNKLIKENNFKISLLKDPWIESMIQRICDDYRLFFYEDMTWRYSQKREDMEKKLNALRASEELKKGLKIKQMLKK